MNLIDLVLNALTVLYQKNRKEYFKSFEVWSYLVVACEEDLTRLGYDLKSFSQFDMDNDILYLLGDNNGNPFRMQRDTAEGGTFFYYYWIPKQSHT